MGDGGAGGDPRHLAGAELGELVSWCGGSVGDSNNRVDTRAVAAYNGVSIDDASSVCGDGDRGSDIMYEDVAD